MLRNRYIPILTLSENGLVKTKNFKITKYIGDALNTVKIFNEKKVDELALIDIDATKNEAKPNFRLIERIAKECRSPISYGGGISSISQIEKIISYGIEKVIISKAFFDSNGKICIEAAKIFGSQSLVICLDVKMGKFFKNKYSIHTVRGSYEEKLSIFEALKLAQDCGAGEIIINSIDRDGLRNGYDYKLIENIYDKTKVPIIITGGAADYEDSKNLMKCFPGVAAGGSSIFTLKGKYDAVLIQYPTDEERC